MELPSDIMNFIKEFIPPHPLQREINMWSRNTHFYRWYFAKDSSTKRKDKIKRFIEDNDFWIKTSGLNNERAVKLKHACYIDKKRMLTKLKQLNIAPYLCGFTTHIPRLNTHGNYSEVFYKNQEIIY